MKKITTLLVTLLLIAAATPAQTRRRPARRTQPSSATAVPQPQPTPVSVSTPRPASAPILLAVVNGQNVTSADIEVAARADIEALDGRIAEARRQILEMEINTALLDAEARKRGINPQQLYDLEVTKKIPTPTAAEIEKFIQDNKNQIDEVDQNKLRQDVSVYLRGQAETQMSEALVQRLRKTTSIVKGADINTPNLAPSTVVATVGGRPLLAGVLAERLKPIIFRLRFNTYNIAKAAADQAINDILLLAEANKTNVGPEEIIRKEVSDKVHPPTDAEVTKFYEENKSRIDGDLGSVKNSIANYLQEQNRNRLEKELSERLRKGADIRFVLMEPVRPVQTISVDDDPSRGDATAAVTIVEFTDFQCPSCAAMHPVIEEVLKSYGNKVRLVVRDFPLLQHTNARKAAEAANAAHAQGKFFEYAALLYKRQDALDVPSLKKYATELGLNRAQFDAALDSGKYADEVKKDLSDGEMYGVESTPTIFVNGVALEALSAEALRAAIDRGLAGAK